MDERVSAINYIKGKKSNIFNTYLMNPLSIQERLYKRVYDAFFNKKNLKDIINFYIILIWKKIPTLNSICFDNISKIVYVYNKIYVDKDISKELKNKLIEEINLSNNNTKILIDIKEVILEKRIHTNKLSKLNKYLIY